MSLRTDVLRSNGSYNKHISLRRYRLLDIYNLAFVVVLYELIVANHPAFCRIVPLFCLKHPAILQILCKIKILRPAFCIMKFSVRVNISLRCIGPMILRYICFEKTGGVLQK